MKVGLELQPCCWSRSGIGTYTYEIAKRLENTDSVEFCGNVFQPFWKQDQDSLKGIRMPIRHNRLLSYGVYRRMWQYCPWDYQDIFGPEVDVSVFFNFIVPPKIRGKVVTTVHDLTFLRYPETMKQSNYNHFNAGLARSVARSDTIITVSEFTKRELQELMDVPEEKIKVVYSAPSMHGNAIADYAQVATQYGITKEYLLFVGTVEPRKNLYRLLKAYDRLKTEKKIDQQLVLAGGNGWENAEIYTLVSNLNHKEDIIFTGFVDGATKNALYRNAKAFVFPSIYEGFGIPPLEAMAHDCPVICAEVASLPEVVGDAAYYVDPFDEDSIAQGILMVLEQEDLREILIARGREQTQKFNWARTGEAFLNMINQMR